MGRAETVDADACQRAGRLHEGLDQGDTLGRLVLDVDDLPLAVVGQPDAPSSELAAAHALEVVGGPLLHGSGDYRLRGGAVNRYNSAVSAVLVIFNRGSRRGGRHIEAVRRWVEGVGLHADVRYQTLADLVGIADPAAIPGRVVAVGGDGTVNGLLTTLHRLGADPVVGIVPAGTGNNLAHGLGLCLDLETACETAFRGTRVRRIDAFPYGRKGDAKTRLIVQSGSLGFPAEIAAQYDRWRRNPVFRRLATPFGTMIYKLLAFCGLNAQRRREKRGDVLGMRCRFPGREGSGEVVLDEKVVAIFLHNEPTVGGGFIPCPDASVEDGLADLCVLRAGTGVSYLEIFKLVGKGEHVKRKDTTIYRQTPGPITVELSSPSPFVSDGDVWLCEAAYEIDVVPAAFGIAVPEP